MCFAYEGVTYGWCECACDHQHWHVCGCKQLCASVLLCDINYERVAGPGESGHEPACARAHVRPCISVWVNHCECVVALYMSVRGDGGLRAGGWGLGRRLRRHRQRVRIDSWCSREGWPWEVRVSRRVSATDELRLEVCPCVLWEEKVAAR